MIVFAGCNGNGTQPSEETNFTPAMDIVNEPAQTDRDSADEEQSVQANASRSSEAENNVATAPRSAISSSVDITIQWERTWPRGNPRGVGGGTGTVVTTFTIDYKIEAPWINRDSWTIEPDPLGTAWITITGDTDLHRGVPLSTLAWRPIYDSTKIPRDLAETVLMFSNQIALNDDLQNILPIPQEQIVILAGPGASRFSDTEIRSSIEQLLLLEPQFEHGRLVPEGSSFELPIRTGFPNNSFGSPAILEEFYENPLGLILIKNFLESFEDYIPVELNNFIGSTLDGVHMPNHLILDIVFFE